MPVMAMVCSFMSPSCIHGETRAAAESVAWCALNTVSTRQGRTISQMTSGEEMLREIRGVTKFDGRGLSQREIRSD